MSHASRPRGHENVATVLVDPAVLHDFELDMMAHDFRVWLVAKATNFADPDQLAIQVRRSLIEWSQGRWTDAADWTVVWVAFGETWRDEVDGEEPIPWPSHAALWNKLDQYWPAVRFNRGLTGVPHLTVPRDDFRNDNAR